MAARPRVALSATYLSIDQPRQWLHCVTSALLAQAERNKQSADFATPLQDNFGLTFDMVDAQADLTAYLIVAAHSDPGFHSDPLHKS